MDCIIVAVVILVLAVLLPIEMSGAPLVACQGLHNVLLAIAILLHNFAVFFFFFADFS